jgi:hypothetical protein
MSMDAVKPHHPPNSEATTGKAPVFHSEFFAFAKGDPVVREDQGKELQGKALAIISAIAPIMANVAVQSSMIPLRFIILPP